MKTKKKHSCYETTTGLVNTSISCEAVCKVSSPVLDPIPLFGGEYDNSFSIAFDI